ncbi:MAG TPA: universal stress protein [Ktedonobacteraceae bacterium]|jgi:hypothetical protein
MNTQRWLLPFTHAVDLQAIDAAIRLAEHSAAALVALSLITPRPGRAPRMRLEQLQESQDFLEAVRWKALRLQVSVECYEIFTEDVAGSISTQVQDLDCRSIVLMHHGPQDALLSPQELKQVLLRPPAPLLFLTLPMVPAGSLLSRLRHRQPRSERVTSPALLRATGQEHQRV